MSAVRLLWEGSFFSTHSLAVVNRELVSRLAAHPGLSAAIHASDAGTPVGWDAERTALLRSLEVGRAGDGEVTVRHQWPFSSAPPAAGRWVVMQPWEYGALPRAWHEAMRFGVDEVWVYSGFNRECYVEAGIPEERVRVVPLGVQETMLSSPRPFPLRTKKRFKFLFVGGTILRKGIDLLVDAYRRGFTAADDVCLVVKDFGTGSFYKGQTYEGRIRELQRTPGMPEIEYLTDDLTPEQLRDLYHACDCLVHPYRGEGFGLPIAEAMACGLPVIVPDQGGASDFCTPETAILLPSRRVAVPRQVAKDLDTLGHPWWLEVGAAELRERMRAVYEAPESVAGVAGRGRALVRECFTWDAAAGVAAERVAELGGRGGAPFRDDAGAQAGAHMAAGMEAWERKAPQAALRRFAQARHLDESADVLFNLASVLITNGDSRTARQVLAQLAERLEEEGQGADPALRDDVRAALSLCPPPTPLVAETPVRVRWSAPIFNASGYASESRAFLEGVVRDASWDVRVEAHEAEPRNDGLMADSLYEQLVARSAPRAGRPHIDFQHGPASAFDEPAAELSVCRTMFETDRIPAEWVEACNRFTEVWVPSEFNRATFERAGVLREKIRIVPGAIDAAAYHPSRYPRERVPGSRGFQFLSVFDFTPRKGWDVLLRAYLEEFGADEDVSLVVKVVNFFREGSPERRVAEFVERHGFRDLPHLVLIDREVGDEELRRLYAGCDAFVLASRGEGWGRPYMEAMAFQKPTIGTRWSANLEFMDDANSFLVEVEGLEPCEQTWSTMPLYRGHRWAVPSVASLREQMRRVFEDRGEAAARAEAARATVESRYDIPVVAHRFGQELARLASHG